MAIITKVNTAIFTINISMFVYNGYKFRLIVGHHQAYKEV